MRETMTSRQRPLPFARPAPSRRDFLRRAAGGFGAIALSGMLADLARAETATSPLDPLAPRLPHYAAKAKSVIWLFMTGGVSHVDSFDPKPALAAGHNKTIKVDN